MLFTEVKKKCHWDTLKNLSVILGLLFLCVFTLIAIYATEWKRGNLKWEDNFEFFNESKWRHVITGNRGNDGQFQYYRKDKRNSYIKNGILHLRATFASDELSDEEIRSGYQNFPGCNVEPCIVLGDPKNDCILPIYSAQLHTKDLFTLTSGKIEVRARFPDGDWLRAGILLFPNENIYGGWPASGQISIAECCGNKHLQTLEGHSVGADTVQQILHWSPKSAINMSYYNDNKKTYWETTLTHGYFSDDFHTYEVEWTENHIAFGVDGIERGRIVPPQGGFWELGGYSINPQVFNPWSTGTNMAPFDRPFYLAIRLLVGGSFFEETFENLDCIKPWNLSSLHPITDFYENSKYYATTWSRPELEVDYVRVYEN